MHIILALLTTVGGIVWALYRLQNSGVNLNSFNPFYWLRRRKWAQQIGTKPIHQLTHSMDAAAVIVVGMAELDGVVTREHKQEIITLFTTEFGMTDSSAADLYAASSHLLKDVANLTDEVKNILAPSKAQYETRHRETLLQMLKAVSEAEGAANKNQLALIQAVEREFSATKIEHAKW